MKEHTQENAWENSFYLVDLFDFETPGIKAEFITATSKNTRLFILALAMAFHTWSCYRKKLYITDVWRNDRASTHFYYRAFDFRIYNHERDGYDGIRKYLTKFEAIAMVDAMKRLFHYADREGLEVIKLHGNGWNYHGHAQVSRSLGLVQL